MSSIQTIKLNDGSEIPWLALGNGSGKAKHDAVNVCKTGLEAGINHIDTAQIYGTEGQTLEALETAGVSRSSVWLTSKIYDTEANTPAKIRASIEGSIAKLGSVPDLFLIHNPYLGNEELVVPTWKVMEDMKDEGRLKSIGVSNFRPQDFEKIFKEGRHKPAVHQIEFHPFVLSHLAPVLEIQAKYNIATESFGPLTPTLRHDTQGAPLQPTLQRIAKRLSGEAGSEIDVNAVLLLWCKAKKVVAITTSSNMDRVKGFAELAKSQLALTKEEVDEIDEVGKKYHYRYYVEHMSSDFPAPDLPSDSNGEKYKPNRNK